MFRWGAVVLGWLELQGDETVLDAGCGSGRVTELLLERLPGGHVIALDGSPSMIDRARTRLERFGERVDFVTADLLDPLPVPAVDAIVSTATFHRVPDHEQLFANLAAVLVPGGELVAQCGGAGNLASVGAALREIGIDGAGSKLYATPEETDERLRGAGFSPVECWLHAEPTPFGSLEELAVYLRTVVLGDLVEGMPRERASAFAREVAGRLPSLKLDYVRLNIRARRREPGPDGAGPTAPSIVPRSRRTMASSPRPRDRSATAGPATGRGGRGHGRRVDDPVRQARSGS